MRAFVLAVALALLAGCSATVEPHGRVELDNIPPHYEVGVTVRW